MGEHYFSAQPTVPDRRRTLLVQLAGRRLTVQTASGVFCPDRLDQGTAVLLGHAPPPPAAGDLLDLGCGWGPIALTLGLLSPEADVWALDTNQRALELTRTNAETAGAIRVRAVLPDAVPGQLRFAAIWSNPPVRVGKAALHALLVRWLPRLDAGGTAYLVVQKNLGADSLHRWLETGLAGYVTDRYASDKGFRILRVARA